MPYKFDCLITQNKTDLDVDYVTDLGTFGFYFSKHFDIVSVHFNTHRVWRGKVDAFFLFVRAMVCFSFMLGRHMHLLHSEVERYVMHKPTLTDVMHGPNT